MTSMRIATALLLAVVLTACGGGGGFESATEVAQAADCADPASISPGEQEMYLTNSVTCTLNGHDLMIGWFKSAAARKSYKQVADSMGGAGIAYGEDWVVECNDAQTDCEQVVSALK